AMRDAIEQASGEKYTSMATSLVFCTSSHKLLGGRPRSRIFFRNGTKIGARRRERSPEATRASARLRPRNRTPERDRGLLADRLFGHVPRRPGGGPRHESAEPLRRLRRQAFTLSQGTRPLLDAGP